MLQRVATITTTTWPSARRTRMHSSSVSGSCAAPGVSNRVGCSNSPELEALFQRYRPNVGLCVVNSQGLVFAAQRNDTTNNTWQMPQGGIDAGEDAAAAAVRELEEETSMRSVRVITCLDHWLTYDFSPEVKARLAGATGSWQQFDGQAQKWFLLHFYGDDSEINVETKDREFKRWQWLPIQDLAASVVSFKKEVYAEVIARFAPVIGQLQENGGLDWKLPSPSNGKH